VGGDGRKKKRDRDSEKSHLAGTGVTGELLGKSGARIDRRGGRGGGFREGRQEKNMPMYKVGPPEKRFTFT